MKETEINELLAIKLASLKADLSERALDPKVRKLARDIPRFKEDMVGGIDFGDQYGRGTEEKSMEHVLEQKPLEDAYEKEHKNPNASQRDPGSYHYIQAAFRKLGIALGIISKDSSEWHMEEPPPGIKEKEEEQGKGFEYPINWLQSYEPNVPGQRVPGQQVPGQPQLSPSKTFSENWTIENAGSKWVIKKDGIAVAEVRPEKMDWKEYAEYVDLEDEDAAREHFFSEEGKQDVLEFVKSEYSQRETKEEENGEEEDTEPKEGHLVYNPQEGLGRVTLVGRTKVSVRFAHHEIPMNPAYLMVVK